ncbi:uncharacterized protein CcaverHIS019_0601650 [Cutaneotrichosporon cavernicola]|uniref:Uncharacterized protein n=1 Tax=Cutaneotrichosporon cavernicola TaxID=279322 RepID=A0AA48QXT2_9TREE|nr:uncharacterized protein CcaverHIS019_0601650 [Cutaneotrichosporon cavernicola]BEI93706.1 hypothetical protein CcaverHIS019_0601650 [Cutaneotrichosporon cavernicola]BEJ01483.1 hypothetical protein CcaverHIS631_0601650 [Cutaneotrichosporon cavernicola]BEJ09249.1 hypothetical protein CcaverHIS641_0601640 [Cutaneotrichosporon cavernicola]
MSPATGSPSSAQWHTVTPHTRPLSISILELAPTSVTLALTRSPRQPNVTPAQHVVHSLAHHHSHHLACTKKKKKHRKVESDENDDDDDSGSASHVPGAYPSLLAEGQTFKDMLSHGVVVTLDGMPWSRIVAHVSDDAEEEETPDDDEEWEDEEESHEEETVGTTSGTAPHAARRRKGRQPSSGRARRPKAHDKPPGAHRWDRERAVVVVYDLDPSKEHEIELQIVGLAAEVNESLVPVSNTVLIPPASPNNSSLHPRSRANSLRSRSRPRSRSNSVNTQAQPGPSPLANAEPASPNRPSTPIPETPVVPTSILSPHDVQTAQTRHLIAAAHAERELLQVQIKEARKTAQRSEAALKSEIESLKKSNEKAGSNDQRNKQKYLALQEQVKQGLAGADTASTETKEVKAGVPELEKRLGDVLMDLEGVKGEWADVNKAEDEAREADKKRRLDEDKKLSDVGNKVDKVRAKRDRKEAERAELAKKLDELERAREDVERRAEEEKTMRRQGYYPGHWSAQHHAFDPRPPSAQPNTNILHQGGNYTGPGFRPRGGFAQRYPSGGRPPPAASPTVGNFYESYARPRPAPNPTAAPFHPGNFSPPTAQPQASPAAPTFDSAIHTALTPPQFQHRIYLPNVRPRPSPNFHPPPSVLAAQAEKTAFPPIAGAQRPPAPTAGPSLASIVTRAVLAPGSEFKNLDPDALGQGPPANAAPGAGRPTVSPTLANASVRGDFPSLSPTVGSFSPPRRGASPSQPSSRESA